MSEQQVVPLVDEAEVEVEERGGGVTVVIPTFNEAETIEGVVEDVLEVLRGVAGRPGRVLVVDDDSPDGTWRLVAERFAREPSVGVIRRQRDRGLSSAILEGLRASRGRYAVIMDGDGQHPAPAIRSMLRLLEDGNADVVVGSRHASGGRVDGWPISRRLTSWGASRLAQAFVPAAREIEDPMSGFFAVDRDVVDDEVLDRADPHGYKILLELVQRVPSARVEEWPITFQARQAGESKLTVDEQLRFLEHVVGLWLVAHGLEDRIQPPLLIRSVEFGVSVGGMIALLYLGLVIGNVDDAGGAALIAAAGAGLALAIRRLWRTSGSWGESEEVFAK